MTSDPILPDPEPDGPDEPVPPPMPDPQVPDPGRPQPLPDPDQPQPLPDPSEPRPLPDPNGPVVPQMHEEMLVVLPSPLPAPWLQND